LNGEDTEAMHHCVSAGRNCRDLDPTIQMGNRPEYSGMGT